MGLLISIKRFFLIVAVKTFLDRIEKMDDGGYGLTVTPKAIEAIADEGTVQVAVSKLNREKHERMTCGPWSFFISTAVSRQVYAAIAMNWQKTQYLLYSVSYQLRDFVGDLITGEKITGLTASQVTSLVFVDFPDIKTVTIIAEGEILPIPEGETTGTVPLRVGNDGEILCFPEVLPDESSVELRPAVIVPTVSLKRLDEDGDKRFYYEAIRTHVKNKAVSVRIRPIREKSADVIAGHCCITFYNYPSGVFKTQYVSYSEYIDLVTHLCGPIIAPTPRTQKRCIPEMVSFYQREKTVDDNDRISRVVTEFILAKGILAEIAEARTETGADVRVREIRERDITEYERDTRKCMAIQIVYLQRTLAVSYVFY